MKITEYRSGSLESPVSPQRPSQFAKPKKEREVLPMKNAIFMPDEDELISKRRSDKNQSA